jgi:glycosyltransferase involved in cell wall biosynthesis
MKPDVSICMITYNHSEFIAQAIESVLMQQTTFSFELIIGEDGSKDDTRKVCEHFCKEYPGIIKLLENDTNLGMMPNFIRTLKACSGKYIALCEGDDYWTDPQKLQKQVSFLESNPGYVISFHRAKIEYAKGIIPFYKEINTDTPATTGLMDICRGNYLHSASVVFKNVLNNSFPAWFATAYPGDWPLHVMNACYGDIGFMNEEMCVYRVHEGGVHSTHIQKIRKEKYLPTILHLIGFIKERHPGKLKNITRTYNYFYFLSAGLYNEQNKNRLQRSWIFYSSGWLLKSKKVLLFCWLPLFFGNKSAKIWAKI